MRAGECMERALRSIVRAVRVGKVLIQRTEGGGDRKLHYLKVHVRTPALKIAAMYPTCRSSRNDTWHGSEEETLSYGAIA